MDDRFKHHPPTSDEVISRHQRLRIVCDSVLMILEETIPDSRERSVAIAKLEEMGFWGHAGIARNQ